jgi:beta-lactam-binding protein with PASTA domain
MILHGRVGGRWHPARGSTRQLPLAPNLVCFTALDLIGALLTGDAPGGIAYLAVGTGDPAWDAQPPPPDRSRTTLTAEIYRIRLRPGVEISYDSVTGAVDVRVSLGPGVATGPLRELGLFGGPATPMPGSGFLVNHKVHDRIDKAAGDTVNRELRLQLADGLLPGARNLIGGLLAGAPGLAGLQFGALGTDGSVPAGPPTTLAAEAFRAPLGRPDLRYDAARHEVVAVLRVPFTAGPAQVAEAGLFGGSATSDTGSGLLVQRQVFTLIDRTAPRSITRRFVLSLVSATAVPVPGVVGTALDAARAALAAADLIPGDVQLAAGGAVPAGTVTAQQPTAGTSVPEGTPVALTVAATATVPVPMVLGLPVATAESAITAAGLVPGDPSLDETEDAPRGSVIAVQPPPGSLVPAGSTVTPTIATPPIRAVPDVVGRTPAAASVLLTSAGFRLADPPYPVVEGGSTAGTIVQQSPPAQTQSAVDQPVSITVSGPWGVNVPDLTGDTLDAAAQALRDAAASVLASLGRPADPPGLTLGATSESPATAGESIGTVVSQQPAAGTRAPLYTAVSLVLAGAVHQPVPPLTGLDLGAAATALTGAGFTLGAVAQRAADTAAGTVVDQDPAAGSSWPPGGRVAVSLAVPLSVVVPDLVGLDQAAAVEGLTSRGLVAGAVTSTATGPGTDPGRVLGQNPASGSVAAKGSSVALNVAAGMPLLIGRSQADAVAAVTALGLTPSVTQQPDDAAPGTVISQDPAAGAPTAAGQTVTIVVAVPRPVLVPDVTGLLLADAQARVAAVGLALVVGGSQEQAGVPEGTVIVLNPQPGTAVPPGSTVTATLSVAPPVMVAVPALTGRSAADAQQLATQAGLVLAVSGTQPSPGTPAGTVLSQDPAAGTSVRTGSTVSVIQAAVDTSVLVPDLRSLTMSAAQAAAQQATLGLTQTGTALSLGPPGVVLSQDPLPNSRVPAKTTIGVVTSVAAVQLPDVIGEIAATASSRLRALGLVVQLVPRRMVDGDGTVFAESPAAGTVVAAASTVTLSYSIAVIRPPGQTGGPVGPGHPTLPV